MNKTTLRLSIAGVLVSLISTGCMRPYPDMRVTSGMNVNLVEEDGYQILNDKTTYGLFPSGIAVARVKNLDAGWPAEPVPEDTSEMSQDPEGETDDESRTADDSGQSIPLLLATLVPGIPTSFDFFPLESYQVAYWTSLFESTPEVREVVLLHEKSVRQDRTDMKDLLRAANIMNTSMLLVYGYDNTTNPTECVVTGLLYDVESGDLVASLRRTISLNELSAAAGKLKPWDRPKKPDDWLFYLDQVAFRYFEKDFKECVWQLIDKDEAPKSVRHNPYALFDTPAIRTRNK